MSRSYSHRFLLVIYPSQSHLNPALQFAMRLMSTHNAHVTLAITLHMLRRMPHHPSVVPALSLATFSDGYDNGFSVFDGDFSLYASSLRRRGSEFITNLIVSKTKQGLPFTCLTYTLLVPWAHDVARGFPLPTALLWIQPATVFAIAHHYFHKQDNHTSPTPIPGLPLQLSPRDILTFLLVSESNPVSFIFPLFRDQFGVLDKDANPTVLVNTFEALEPEALRAVDGINMIPIGPLIPSALLGGDLFHASTDCFTWLNSKANDSVVYVSFGSYLELSKRQMEEIAVALLECGRPFLWVVRDKLVDGKEQEEELWRREELEEKGLIVKWCSQVEVLSHPSVGCFVTHCGWNSTLESLVCGVPVVAFPHWADQNTNAKMIEDVWKTGVRVDEDGVVKGEEIRRCLKLVMDSGGEGEVFRRNAEKWRRLAREAGSQGGPSENNFRTFLHHMEHLRAF